METLHRMIDDLREEIVETLQRWIQIPSTKAERDGDAPFGQAVKKSLEVALQDCQRLGLHVRNFNNYAGDARMGKLDVDPFAILVHLDVVPAGDGWHVDPYAAVMEADRMYGRGTMDDKGPAVAALYAMHAILKAGVPLRREVRFILGCDEESGWEDMEYYKNHCDLPQTGFSPDACFPLINTEKGMLQIDLHGAFTQEGLQVESIDSGYRRNVIPGNASALIQGDQALCDKANHLAGDMHLQVEATMQDGLIKLSSTGINGHSAYPEIARNAIGQLLLMLRALGVQGMLRRLADTVGLEYDGSSLGIHCSDETSGALTCNMGILKYDKKGCFATLDIRYPLLANGDRIFSELSAALGEEIQVTVTSSKNPHHVSPHSELVKKLLDAYHEETGLQRECLSTGGGTYARCLMEGVAFGSQFPGDEELAHQAGEYITIENLMKNVHIFANAILKLAGE